MVKALFECKGNDCGERSLCNDVDHLPGKWVAVTISQNLFDGDEEIGTFTYTLEFCSIAHAAERMSDLEKLKARVIEEEAEENG